MFENSDNYIESKKSPLGTKRNLFLMISFILVTSFFFGMIVLSLFQKFANGLGMDQELELSSLVAPVQVEAEEPPPPKPDEPKPKKEIPPNADVRKEIIQDINEAPVKPPEKISAEKPVIPPRRPEYKTIVGDDNSDAAKPVSRDYQGEITTKGVGGSPKPNNGAGEEKDEEPPPPIKTPTPRLVETPTPTPKPPPFVSGGVVNGKAVNLVKPPYPPAAKAVRASGQVNVQVMIDENGNVISASAVSGHALLRQAAEQAARSSKFSPTLLSGQKVKVSGQIIYNFNPQ